MISFISLKVSWRIINFLGTQLQVTDITPVTVDFMFNVQHEDLSHWFFLEISPQTELINILSQEFWIETLRWINKLELVLRHSCSRASAESWHGDGHSHYWAATLRGHTAMGALWRSWGRPGHCHHQERIQGDHLVLREHEYRRTSNVEDHKYRGTTNTGGPQMWRTTNVEDHKYRNTSAAEGG